MVNVRLAWTGVTITVEGGHSDTVEENLEMLHHARRDLVNLDESLRHSRDQVDPPVRQKRAKEQAAGGA